MNKIALVLIATIIGGCSSAALNVIDGKYYLAGDSNCVRYRQLSESRIMCINKKGEEVGYRDAMTDQELQVYMYNQQQTHEAIKSFSESMRSMSPKYTNCYKTYSGMNCTTY